MKPADIETLISMSLDHELDASQEAELAAIFKAQPEYLALKQELEIQKAQCAMPAPEPPGHLYQKTRHKVEDAFPASSQRGIKWQAWLAFAAVAILAFSVGYLVPKTPERPLTMANLPQMEQTLLTARLEFHDAIKQLEELAHAQIAQMPPEVAERVNENLKIVDNAIQACEDFAQAYPGHYAAYASLAKAYQAKVDLLETLVDGSQHRS